MHVGQVQDSHRTVLFLRALPCAVFGQRATFSPGLGQLNRGMVACPH